MIIHIVSPGESVYGISREYGVPPQEIIEANALVSPELLVPGQALVIPGDISEYIVRRGDSMYSIARKYGVSLNELLSANPRINDPSNIREGQTVIVPRAEPKQKTIYVNGYVLPGIRMPLLQSALPYLTYLSIFSYQVKPDGSLAPLEDEPLIKAARNAGVAPMMVITNLREGEGFSSDLAHTILTDERVQNVLLDNVEKVLKEKNYFGLDIDFEYIYPNDRESYNSFLRKASEKFRPIGYTISTALAPKMSADQPGVLYEAHDYPVHGALVDHVILMTYEWGYTSAHLSYRR